MISSLGLWFLLAGYIVVSAFMVIERLLRPTAGGNPPSTGDFDRGSTLLVASGFGAGLALPPIMVVLGIAPFPIAVGAGVAALAVLGFGLGLRVWAAIALGRFYTATLLVSKDHKVITTGPYARIRHPGYLGSILLWSGFGVLSGSLVLAFLFPIMFVAIYLCRISVEERMLITTLGEDYVQYQQRTRKLIPFIY